MAVYTDTRDAAAALLPGPLVGTLAPVPTAGEATALLLHAIYDGAPALYRAPLDLTGWRALLVRDHATSSQYDALVRLIRSGADVPDAIACVARTGAGMHGFRARPWSALAGNIHLTVHFAPDTTVPRFESAFTALAAVSAAEAAETVPGLAHRVRIKWVNDVLVDGCKVGGVLAYTQTRDTVVTSVVLGIGLNVLARPVVERSPYVPAAACLLDFGDPAAAAGDTGVGSVLWTLLDALRRNYTRLLTDGPAPLLDAYRARSAVIGTMVTVMSDDVASSEILAAGRVTGIGDGLELYIDGHDTPITRGRLLAGAPADG